MIPPEFHVAVPLADIRVGDLVYFRADQGGYRLGHVKSLTVTSLTVEVNRGGIDALGPKRKVKSETVVRERVKEAFRDTYT